MEFRMRGNGSRRAWAWMAAIAIAFAPRAEAQSKLKKILVLDKAAGDGSGHRESRGDLNKALAELAAEKGFTVTTIVQNDPASKVTSAFSAANLATFQAVLFSNNDGVDGQLDAASRANVEAYVKGGGALIPIHAASAFIGNWPWLRTALVQCFYGPHGSNQPTANVSHDPDGNKEGSETKGIFKGLTAPAAFLDEYYSFQQTPRGVSGVTILLTVDESSYSKTIEKPMGSDHPVVWAKSEGKGRVIHMSMGHSWSFNNVYAAKDSYLKKFLYGALRYGAGDFIGCTDKGFAEYSADATKSDPTACKTPVTSSISTQGNGGLPLISQGNASIQVEFRAEGPHEAVMLDMAGKVVEKRSGNAAGRYELAVPAKAGLYLVKAKADGKVRTHRITVL